MRSLPGSLAATLLLLLSLPATGSAAAPVAPPPSCAAGPARSGDEIVGTPCADRIVVPASVQYVDAGAGDDTIVGANSAPVTAASGSPETGLHLEVGSQTFEGGPGNDIVYGDRGNDTLRGNAGNDRLYGGIGDDVLEGGEGDDLLAGGFGADKIDGQAGNDYVRGDATIDHIFDTGGGFDTLSFATGATPGFFNENQERNYPNFAEYGLPGLSGERGVYVNLAQGFADNNSPNFGGGIDEIEGSSFERIIGSPFSDYIVGNPGDEQIYGGGGADVILGEGGNDLLNGGADGDYLDGGSGSNTIEAGPGDNCVNPAVGGCGSAKSVSTRATGLVSVGETIAVTGLTQVYLVGSSANDTVTASYGGSGSVSLTLSGASFDTSLQDSGGCTVAATTATCPVSGLLDAIVLAGMGGGDTISANVPDGVSVVELGGEGVDHLNGSASEDTLVDGPGSSADVLAAGAGDDALTHNDGADLLDGGEGSDLFLSVALCKGESIVGGAERVAAPVPDRDNASWARLGSLGVDARIDQSRVGEVGSGGNPQCASGSFDTLSGIEDLEGSSQNDYLVGDGRNNQLLGHKGADSYFGLAGQDSLLANSGTPDLVINCGADLDSAIVDFAAVGDPAPIECESVREGAVEEFKELELLAPPPAPPPPPPTPPPPDRKPPRTELRRHPAKILKAAPGRRLSVSFRFAASEPGATFRCKLDRKPYGSCRSPRTFRVGLGRHSFKLFAIDAAGNRDRTPAVFSFRVVRAQPAHARR
jgi:Ca2+-binding RTX toxin-like protein